MIFKIVYKIGYRIKIVLKVILFDLSIGRLYTIGHEKWRVKSEVETCFCILRHIAIKYWQ